MIAYGLRDSRCILCMSGGAHSHRCVEFGCHVRHPRFCSFLISYSRLHYHRTDQKPVFVDAASYGKYLLLYLVVASLTITRNIGHHLLSHYNPRRQGKKVSKNSHKHGRHHAIYETFAHYWRDDYY